MRRFGPRRALVLACMAAFVVAIALSMGRYPGGTWWDRHQSGHSFWQNFLCDLLHDPALNHQPNPTGALLAKAGMLLFVLGLCVHWSLTNELLCCRHRLSAVVRWLGVGGTPLVAAVPLLPSNQYPALHTVAVTLGGLPALCALLLFTFGVLAEPHCRRAVRLLTPSLALWVLLCLSLYVREAVLHHPALRALPALERITSIMAVLWIVASLPRRGPAQ